MSYLLRQLEFLKKYPLFYLLIIHLFFECTILFTIKEVDKRKLNEGYLDLKKYIFLLKDPINLKQI